MRHAMLLTRRKLSGASREMVRSHSTPPLELRIWVYVTAPTGLSRSLSVSHCRAPSAPRPCTSHLLNEQKSKIPALVRVAACSAGIAGDQLCRTHPVGVGPGESATSLTLHQLGRSHPAFSPKAAPRVTRRGYGGLVRRGRADRSEERRVGKECRGRGAWENYK